MLSFRTPPTTLLVCAALLVASPLASSAGRSAYAPAPEWIVTLDPGGFDLGEGAGVDALGNVYVTGIAESRDQQDIVTSKVSPTGAVVWTRTLDRGPADRGEDVAVAPGGGAVVVGSVGTRGGDDVIVAKYSPTGELVWTTTFDKGTSEVARGVVVDAGGDILVAGTSMSNAGADGFLARFDPEGKEIWSRPINLFFFEEVFDVIVTPEGNAVVAGRVLRQTDFDVLLRAFSADGRVLWTQYLATPAREEGRGIGALADNSVVVVGTQEREDATAPHDDILVARFSRDGDLLWSKTFDLDGADDAGRDVVVDSSGNLLVTGFGRVGTTKDPILLKISDAGTEIWRAVEPMEGIAGTGAVAVGPNGRIVTAGARQASGGDFAYLLLAYDERPPSAAFRASPGAAARTMLFEDASAPGDAAIVGHRWDFGDGTSSTDANPSHVFEWGGTYVAKLTVTDAAGNRGVATKTLTVEGPARPVPTPGVPGATHGEPTPTGPAARPTPSPTPTETEETPGPSVGLALAALALAGFGATRRRAR